MVSPSRRPQSQAGGVTTTKSLLTWTLLLISAATGQAKVEQYIRPHSVHRSRSAATAEIASSVPRRPEAGSSPAEIPLLNKDVHTAKFRNTEPEYADLKKYQDASAPARQYVSAVRAPLGQSTESTGLVANPGARPLQDWEADDFILLSTIDGSLHARERSTGQHRWTLEMPDDPMIQTVHYPQNRSYLDNASLENEYMFIVEPSKDGQLYAQFMDPKLGLVRLAATVKKMATETPFMIQINNQYLTTSSEQQSKAYTIDALTGEILFGSSKHRSSGRPVSQPRCRRRNDLELEDPACRPGRTIRLGRNVYTFTISNEQTGEDLCTIRFSEWVTNRLDHDLQQQHTRSLDDMDLRCYYNGKIVGLDVSDGATRLPRFTQMLNSPVARVFDVVRQRDDHDDSADLVLLSRPMDLPYDQPAFQAWREQLKNSQRVFVNKTHAGDWFALSEYAYPGATIKAPHAKVQRNHDGSFLNLNGDLNEIIGVHELTDAQTVQEPVRLTIAPPPENENSNTFEPETQVIVQEPAQPPALITNNVDAKSWGSGFFGVLIGGILVLLLNSKFNLSSPQPALRVQNVEDSKVVSLQTAAPPNIVIPEKLEPPQSFTKAASTISYELIDIDGVTLNAGVTPNHSRGQSTTSVDSPKKRSVKIGDLDDNNSSDGESDDEEGNNDAGLENSTEQMNGDDAAEARSRKPKTRRGKRGGKKGKKKKSMDPGVFDEKPVISLEQHLDNGMVQIGRLKVDISEEKCLGRGSNGTAVYPGVLDGREVAVKRLIKSANNLAEKEIKHLVSSDENPHVIRYFGKEESRDFFYIALDQFTTSLDQFIEHPERFPTLVDEAQGFDIKDCLRQITDGVQHLHSLKLVHRDIKPQNVLVRAVKSNRPVTGIPKLQFVISDFGLCKPLEDGAMSTFAPTANHTAAGTTGWRAPELLVSPRDAIAAPNAESSNSRTVSTTHSLDGTTIDPPSGRRATKAIDIFSLGCVFYYVMTRGAHPFDVGGSSLGRDLNIKENNFTTDLMRFHKYEYDAEDLIMQMINHEPKNRPDTVGVLKHPCFWTTEQKLEFVCLVSDCYEREKNSVTDIHAKGPVERTPAEEESLVELAALEALAPNVIGLNSKKEVRDFLAALPRTFLNGMGKQRSYTGTRMIDLLRLIRNKKNHFRDLPDDVQSLILARGASLEEGYYGFWADRFPALLINCHANISERRLAERFRLERWYD